MKGETAVCLQYRVSVHEDKEEHPKRWTYSTWDAALERYEQTPGSWIEVRLQHLSSWEPVPMGGYEELAE